MKYTLIYMALRGILQRLEAHSISVIGVEVPSGSCKGWANTRPNLVSSVRNALFMVTGIIGGGGWGVDVSISIRIQAEKSILETDSFIL